MKTAIEQNKKFKEAKRKEKEKAKKVLQRLKVKAKKEKAITDRKDYKERIVVRTDIKKQNLINSTISYYEKLKTTAIDKVAQRYQRKIERRLSKINKQYEAKKNTIIKTKVYKKEVKKKWPTIWKIKQEAYKVYQYYRKLSLADQYGMVYLVDVGGYVHRSLCVAGHIYSKHNNKHMAFIDKNVRPITYETNRVQWTAPWVYRAVNVLDEQELKYLKKISDNKLEKNKVLDRNFYQYQFDYYTILAKKEEQRLWIPIC